jgi:monothiol glutaredoxin
MAGPTGEGGQMSEDVQTKIDELVKGNKVVLFMKGTPDFPQCGFSMRAVQILRALEAKFVSVNVLADPQVRQGIKVYSDWPTIPQLYVNGQFVGGSDIAMQMFESGDLAELVAAEG